MLTLKGEKTLEEIKELLILGEKYILDNFYNEIINEYNLKNDDFKYGDEKNEEGYLYRNLVLFIGDDKIIDLYFYNDFHLSDDIKKIEDILNGDEELNYGDYILISANC
ncbi:MAG: hypothetical protein PHI37_03700 [Candidatus Gracilibacteria bacterium]|nr:hypothetical protein [Candidatus Gracilibacteria bacterium]